MSGPPVREFALAMLVGTCGRLLFQQRDDVPGIGYPGWIGLFGGHREGAETFSQCASREVHEEIGYLIAPERFDPLGSYAGPDPDGGNLLGEFFLARDVPVDQLYVTEGSLLLVGQDELPALLEQLEPSARLAAQMFLSRQR